VLNSSVERHGSTINKIRNKNQLCLDRGQRDLVSSFNMPLITLVLGETSIGVWP
jgi:hypothetical protein